MKLYKILSTLLILLLLVLPTSAHFEGDFEFGANVSQVFFQITLVSTGLLLVTIWTQAGQRISKRDYTIISLAGFTVIIHFLVSLGSFGSAMFSLLLLNSIGGIGLVVAFYISRIQASYWNTVIRWLWTGFLMTTIVGFFFFHPFGLHEGHIEWLGLVTKLTEVLLICGIWIDKIHLHVDSTPNLHGNEVVNA